MTRLIALSAAYGAGGSIIGPALADRLGVPFLDRAIPLAVAERLEVSYDDAAAHDEKAGAGWLERVLTAFAAGDTGVPALLRGRAVRGRLPARHRGSARAGRSPRAKG